MSAGIAFVGHAIVSADGMIAAADGTMPPALHVDADWLRFQAALDRAALVVLGRKGHALHPNPGRRRLVLTRSVASLATDPADPNATLWNPARLTIGEVLSALGITSGTVAITGGTGTFDLFAPRLTRFDLSEVADLSLPGGTPCFSAGHPRDVLAAQGMRAMTGEPLAPGVTLTTWLKPAKWPYQD